MNKTLFFLTALILLSCSDNQSQINVDEIVKKANAPLLKGLGNHSFKISSDIAKPTALEIPCPNGPVVVSIPVFGWYSG